jgi:hypothetical protein
MVIVSARVSNFVPGKSYRLGVGCAGDKQLAAEVALSKADAPITKDSVEFKQGNTAHWWNVPELWCVGFTFTPDELSTQGLEFKLTASVDREVADACGKLYIFVSRDYGSSTWYLEDGSELEKTLW